ncbi:MAG TPA: hypothetical protein VIK01_03305 [Polyangiaceae bacterium]
MTSSSDPTVLAVINERVSAIVVDAQRIYWLGSVGGSFGTLHSCEKQNCVGSLVTYGTAGNATLGSPIGVIGVAGGQVYWWELEADNNGIALKACELSGCEHGARTVASHVVETGAAAFSADYAYVVTGYTLPGAMLRIPLTGNDAQPEQVFATGGSEIGVGCSTCDMTSLAVQGDYLYWQGLAGQGNANSTINRARVDGGGEVEVLADHLGIGSPASLTLDASYVYWSDGLLSGSIVRCPLTGCVGAPESLVGPVRLPTTVRVDGPNLYWQQATTASGLVISSCALATCAPSQPIARGVDDTAVLAIDDEYLYTATTDQKVEPGDLDWTNPSASIRRIRK